MDLKKTLITFGLVLIVMACTPPKENKSREADSLDAAPLDSLASVTDEQKQIHQINNQVKAIDLSIANYDSLQSFLPWHTDTVVFTEFRKRDGTYEPQRKKLICRSFHADKQYLSILGYDSVTSVVRSYYYDDHDELLFLKEVLRGFDNKDASGQLVNEFYFQDNKIIGWISASRPMEHHAAYPTLQAQFNTWQQWDALPYYNFIKGSDKTTPPEVSDRNRESLEANFKNAVALKYAALDSIRSGPTDSNINFVVEAFYHTAGKREAALYLLEIAEGSKEFHARPRYIGRHDWTTRSVETPGDFYYYLMTLERDNNLTALASCIRKTGYPISISDGDEEDHYSEAKTIKRDSVNFENLHFEFDMYKVNFTFNLSIEEMFSTDGSGSFGYSGGGFYNAVSIKKEGDKVFLEGYNFNGH